MGARIQAMRSRASAGAGGRRRRLRIAAAVLAVTGLAFTTNPVSAQQPGEGNLPPGDYPPEQVNFANYLVERTERELPAFGDVEDLEAMGFVNIGVTAPGGYDHYTNVAWLADDYVLDPTHPESLVFRRTADGGYELQAAMFFLGPTETMETIPWIISWLPGWHAHPELCGNDRGQVVGIARPDGTCAVGQPVLIPMTHVWIVDNACNHRFGGVDAGGLHCDYEHDHGGEHAATAAARATESGT